MFFDKEDVAVSLLDVIELDQRDISLTNTCRNFNALSFRLDADTRLFDGEKSYELLENSICFIPAGLEYRRVSAKDHLIVIHFNIQNYIFDRIECFQMREANEVKELFQNILETWNARKPDRIYACTSIFNAILSKCLLENFAPNNSKSRIEASVRFMEDSFTDPELTVGRIAEKSFMSEVYFRRLFKEVYGISPSKHIINLKIQKAVNLMATGYYSLKEVAKLSGYSDYAYFSSEFKRINGVSPSEYFYNY